MCACVSCVLRAARALAAAAAFSQPLHHTQQKTQHKTSRCYEVACVRASVTDGYGQTLDRHGACQDESKPVTVTITGAGVVCMCVLL